MLIFSGSANPTLAAKLATALHIPLGRATIAQFADSESQITIHDPVRTKTVFIVQPTSTPVNHHIIELCLLANALRRSGAGKIIAIVPYFGYARQDFAATQTGCPHSAQVIANIFNTAGFDQMITVDLHAAKIQEFFNFKVENLSSLSIFLEDIQSKQLHNPIIVSPDIGGEIRARKFAYALQIDLAVIAKRRKDHDTAVIHIIGTVKDRDCIIIDDIIDTGNTLITAIRTLKTHGARNVHAYCTHAVMSGSTLQTLLAAECEDITVTDSIELRNCCHNKVKQISIVELLKNHIKTAVFAINENHYQ